MPKYNRTAAAAYARKWATGTNPKYGRIAPDCTNFVSQALHEGGWPMVGSHNALNRANVNHWWIGDSHFVKASHTWGAAENFYQFLRASRRGSLEADPMKLELGDVVQYQDKTGRARHTMIVTGKTKTDLLLSYHSNDTLDKPLSKINPANKVLVYWRIADMIPTPKPVAVSPMERHPVMSARR